VRPPTRHSSRLAESGRLVRRMSHRVDPAAIAEEARTVRLDAVLGPPRRSVPVGDSSTPESRTLTPLIMVRIQVPQPLILMRFLRLSVDRVNSVGSSVGNLCSLFELPDCAFSECWIAPEIVRIEDCLHVAQRMAGNRRYFRFSRTS
jgi:hypothetical protein